MCRRGHFFNYAGGGGGSKSAFTLCFYLTFLFHAHLMYSHVYLFSSSENEKKAYDLMLLQQELVVRELTSMEEARRKQLVKETTEFNKMMVIHAWKEQ